MTTPVTGHQSPATEVKPPCCPHCGGELLTVNLFNWVFAPSWLIMECHCPHEPCRKSLAFQIVPLNAPQEPHPPSPRLIS